MLHLSRLIPNPRSAQVRRDLANSYDMHRTLMRAFPDARSGGPGRVLWRLDQFRDPPLFRLLVQSDKRPDWSALDHHWLDRPAEVREFNPTFAEGQVLRFRLRANPTKRVSPRNPRLGSSRAGKRLGLVNLDDQISWLARRARTAGFTLVGVDPHPDRREPLFAVVDRAAGASVARKYNGPTGRIHTLTHTTVVFEGLLKITDSRLFQQTIAAGIGPAKAFGFGLLSLAPAQ